MDNITIDNQGVEFICEDVAQLEGFEFPTTRNIYIDPPNRGGSLYINSLPGRRRLSWRGLIRDDVQVNRRLLANVCKVGNLKTLKFVTCDGVALQTQIEVDALLNPYHPGRSPYQIQATAPDYRFYSQSLHSANIGTSNIKAGTPIPAAIPAPIPGGSLPTLAITNIGNEITNPVFTIRGPGTNFIIQNLDTGEKITLQTTITSAETVVIDTANSTVMKGNQNIFGSIVRENGYWVTLQPGINRIVFRAQSGITSNTRLTIEWRDAYGGV